MVRGAVGFCPGHISGYFKAVCGDSPDTTGSIGAGIVIAEGVRAQALPADTPIVCIRQQGSLAASGSPPIEYAMRKLGVSAAITTECRLPIGAGFGLSAAALLASVTALNHLFSIGLDRFGIAAVAHESEIVHRTGLGDVAACQGGGLTCRNGPGIFSEIIREVHIGEPIYALSFGPISTPTVLGSPERMEQVKAAYPARHPRDLRDFFTLSREFAERSGLITPDVREVLAACSEQGIPASMTMLGRGVFALGTDAAGVLREFGEVYSLNVAQSGFSLLEDSV
jgi:pantoate kinase